jgi:hypothetical protein
MLEMPDWSQVMLCLPPFCLLLLSHLLTCSKGVFLLGMRHRMIAATVLLLLLIFGICEALLCLGNSLYGLPFFPEEPVLASVRDCRISFRQGDTS